MSTYKQNNNCTVCRTTQFELAKAPSIGHRLVQVGWQNFLAANAENILVYYRRIP